MLTSGEDSGFCLLLGAGLGLVTRPGHSAAACRMVCRGLRPGYWRWRSWHRAGDGAQPLGFATQAGMESLRELLGELGLKAPGGRASLLGRFREAG